MHNQNNYFRLLKIILYLRKYTCIICGMMVMDIRTLLKLHLKMESVKDFSARSGIPAITVYKILSGERKDQRLSTAYKIQNAIAEFIKE